VSMSRATCAQSTAGAEALPGVLRLGEVLDLAFCMLLYPAFGEVKPF